MDNNGASLPVFKWPTVITVMGINFWGQNDDKSGGAVVNHLVEQIIFNI